MDSVLQKTEAEIVMRNIIVILFRTGNKWRKLSFDEYKIEREKDGRFTMSEKEYFDKVMDYVHPERIGLFASGYKEIWKS